MIQCRLQIVKRNDALCVHRKIRHMIPHLLQAPHRLFYGSMFDCGGNNVVSRSFICLYASQNSHIIRFRPTGSKYNFFFLRFYGFCYFLSGFFDIIFRPGSHCMKRRRIPVILCQKPHHDFCGPRAAPCRRSIV